MAQPYSVKNEGVVDFLLAGLRGAVAGYAGGQAARKQAKQLEFENNLKLEQMQIERDRLKQVWDIAKFDADNRWKELIANQTFTAAITKYTKEADNARVTAQMAQDIVLKAMDYKIQNHLNNINIQKDIFIAEANIANDKRTNDIREQAEKNEQERLKSEEAWKKANFGLAVEGLGLEKGRLKLSALGQVADIYAKYETEKKIGSLKYGEVTEADINGADARVQAALKRHESPEDKGGGTPGSAVAYSNATLEYAKLVKQKDGSLETVVVVPEVDTRAETWTGKTNPLYGKPTGKVKQMSFREYLDSGFASETEKQIWKSDNPYAAIQVLQSASKQKQTKEEGVSAGSKNIIDELLGIAGITVPAEKENKPSPPPKMYPMKPVTKKQYGGAGRSWGETISKEAQDYIDFVKSKGYKSVSDLPEEDIKELKRRGMYEDVKRGW